MNDRIRRALEDANPWWRDPRARIANVRPYRRRAFDRVLQACFDMGPELQAVLLTGLRRVGKTELALQVASEAMGLVTAGHQLCWVKVDDPRLDGVLSMADVLEAWHPYRHSELPGLLVLDEVHRLGDRGRQSPWARQLKGAVDLQEFRVLATGSAALQMREGTDEAAGRFRSRVLEPLSFREFRELTHLGIEMNESTLFNDRDRYLIAGGFPGRIQERGTRALEWTRELASQCLSAIHGVRRDARLRQLFAILMDQSSEELNVLALSRELGVERATVENWIAALEDSFLVQRLPGLETSELRRLRHTKLHATDPGLVAAFASSSDPLGDSRSLGRILEAAVLRHLREVARNASARILYVQLHSSHGSKRGEVDFLLLTDVEAFFVEVTGSLAGPAKSKGLAAQVAAYRSHRKSRSQLAGRQAFALVVTGETDEAGGVATAARFLDRVLEAPMDDPCRALRAMSTEVAQ